MDVCAIDCSDPCAAPAVAQARRLAEPFFRSDRSSHDWEHTLRVLRLCCDLGPREGADMVVLLVAALWHDIGRRDQDASRGEVCHAERGAALAAWLSADLPLTDGQKANVQHCVRAHRYRREPHPETLEARVLFDADKLDAIGAVGIARAYQFAGEIGARLHNPDRDPRHTRPYTREDTGYREYQIKLRFIKDRLLTEAGRRVAQERHRFMVLFFDRLQNEIDGHC